jgi:hypothetical protein
MIASSERSLSFGLYRICNFDETLNRRKLIFMIFGRLSDIITHSEIREIFLINRISGLETGGLCGSIETTQWIQGCEGSRTGGGYGWHRHWR